MRAGIDPGAVSGALALLNDDLTAVTVLDMPIEPSGKRQEINAAALGKILSFWKNEAIGLGLVVILEQVHSMPRQGVASSFAFGDSFGCIRGVCGALQIPLFRISPGVWKKKAGLIGKPKDAARALAQQLYPEVDLSHKKDVGRADALLIARFGGL